MTRRKWRIKKVMAVPANWQGTPDHFYHFLLGYFMPVILWQERSGTTEFAVRDCGPMNPWFDLTRSGSDIEFMPPGIMLERLLSHRQERVILRDWDNPTRFHRSSLATFGETIRNRLDLALSSAPSDVRRITVLDRRPSDEYFRSSAADSRGSGSDRRSVPNIADVAEALSAYGTVSVVDTATMNPTEQVRLLTETNLLVAQHGAGLANMVWMPAGAAVLEIKPPLERTIGSIFSNQAAACRLGYAEVAQADEHAVVDAGVVAEAAARLLADPDAFIPTGTGSLPVRLLRQLPRRL